MNIIRKIKLSRILDINFTDYETFVISEVDNIFKDIESYNNGSSIYFMNKSNVILQKYYNGLLYINNDVLKPLTLALVYGQTVN